MPTLEQTRTSIEGVINGFWNAISNGQSNRFAARNHYLQRLATHTVTPSDGNPVAADRIAVTPSDEDEDGTEYFTFPETQHTNVRIDVHDGPDGESYTCVFEFDWTATGMRQRKVIRGPVKSEDDWIEYDPNQNPFQ